MIQRDLRQNMKTMSSIKMANKSFIRIRKDGDDDEREVKWFCRSFSSPSLCYDNVRYPGPSDRVISPLESFRRSAWCVPIINIIMEHQNQHRQIIKSFLMTGRDFDDGKWQCRREGRKFTSSLVFQLKIQFGS